MRKTLLLFACIVLGTIMLSSFRSSSTVLEGQFCDEMPAGIYADPEHCDRFFVCSPDNNGGMRTFYGQCPEWLIYNPEDQLCDFTANVDPPCGIREVE